MISWSSGRREHVPYSKATVSRANITGEEIVGEDLNLGEFDLSRALSVSEANLLMTLLRDHRRSSKAPLADKDIVLSSASYLEEFARVKDKETIGALESLMAQRPELEDFEKAQLMSLQPAVSDEAKTLVPSLGVVVKDNTGAPSLRRMEDADLNSLLNDMGGLCNLAS